MSPNRILTTIFLLASAFAGTDIHIDESIPYRDKEEVDTCIVSECLEVGNIMSESLQETTAKSDVAVIHGGRKQGTYADITITFAMSTGNAFIGHTRRMAISATLYVDGKQVGKKASTRNSSGGMFGAYKSSCAILNRASKVLDSDIAQWVVREQRNTQDR